MTSFKIQPDIILYGGPGSGKSTQAEILVKKLKAKHMNMGGLLRNTIAKKLTGWQDAKKYVDKGQLVPERITSQLVHDFVAKTPRKQRIVFDGYPRRVLQIRLLKKAQQKFDREAVMVLVDLSASAAKRRLISRAKIEGRIDDTNPKTVSERIRVFQERSREVVKYYQQQKKLIKINGDQTIPEVAQDIWQAVNKL
ncbi:MAG: nucleoside monophosphate kinase [Patescibacteria group bacterium]|jgi:adenylate kinase